MSANNNGNDGGDDGAWMVTPGGRKMLHRDEGTVMHGGYALAAVIENAAIRAVDVEELEIEAKAAVASACRAQNQAPPTWDIPIKCTPGMVVDAANDKEISVAMLAHDNEYVMQAIETYCRHQPMVVAGVSLRFIPMAAAMFQASQCDGRTPSAVIEAGGKGGVFCQICGIPPQSDADLDNIGAQLEQVYGYAVPTIQMCIKYDHVKGEPVQVCACVRLAC